MPGRELISRLKRASSISDDALAIMARAPEKGRVKTRLARDLGDARTLEVYQGFVEKIIASARKAGCCPIVFFHPPDRLGLMQGWLGHDITFMPQKGRDLGMRMVSVFECLFRLGAARVVLTGSDIPAIESRHFTEAFELLQTHGGVIGPARDGGYWLIGFCREAFSPDLFQKIAWGTGTVFRETLDRAESLNLYLARLEILNDIDTLADFEQYQAALTGDDATL